MKAIPFDQFIAAPATAFDRVVGDREEVIVTREGHEAVVVVALDEYESLREALHVMSSPANARRLLDSIEELESGRGIGRDLIA